MTAKELYLFVYGAVIEREWLDEAQDNARHLLNIEPLYNTDEVILIMANANPSQLEAAAKEARAVIFSRLLDEFGGKCESCEYSNASASLDGDGCIDYRCNNKNSPMYGWECEACDGEPIDFGCNRYKWNGEVVK